MSDLSRFIHETRLVDTHEHLRFEEDWVDDGPDVLQDLFGNYVPADLVVAGASQEDVDALLDRGKGDVAGRFERVRKAWEAVRHTGYGEAVRILAEDVYGMPEITADGLAAAQAENERLRAPGQRLALLRDRAGLDHVQTDNFCWACEPDVSGPGFFLYDLSWVGFCNGEVPLEEIERETGIAVGSLDSLREAMAAIYAKYAPHAIAVKAQHAYSRTLRWEERSDADAAAALEIVLRDPENVPAAAALCLGDWGWARGVELSIEHNLPFKIHTGYYAGHSRMPVDRIKSGNLCGLLARYLDARFVLMHIAYPYSHELIALAKHYPNVWVDLCWAWSIDPFSSCDFVRRFIHAVPINKLFAFGGDTGWPTSAYAYAVQARKWLASALEAEVRDGLLTEKQAMDAALRLMQTNQRDCFDIAGTRGHIERTLAAQTAAQPA